MNRNGGRIFYGWWIAGACFIIGFVVFGISVNTFTAYVKPIEGDLGWSRGKISAGMSLGALAMGASAPFIGRLIDRMGARAVMAAGGAGVGLSMILVSRAHSLPYFWLMYVLSGISQAGATLIPISLVISNWFSAKRGTALGLVMTGTGLGAMVMVPVTTEIIVRWNWRMSAFIMGCLIILVSVPLNLIFIRTRPSDMGLLPDGGVVSHDAPLKIDGVTVSSAFKTPAFWLIGAMMLIFALVAMGIGIHMMPYLTDIGHTEKLAARVVALISGITVLGKIGMGFVADRWGIRKVVAFTCATIIVGILLLTRARDAGTAFIFAGVYGFAIGAPLVINPSLTAQCLGLAHFGAIFGILTLLSTLGAATGAWLTGTIFDKAHSYMPAFVLYIVLTGAAVACGMMARKEREAELE
ncbi:MAG: MFS transporter [Candidatus Lindowbacteria bacterium]|nr:MFS transporter [Candidatus Lindowbacteria bacterium]